MPLICFSGEETLIPLVRIDLDETVSDGDRIAIAHGLHAAVVDALDEVPDEDNFQIMTVHAPGELVFHPTYAGPGRPVNRQKVIYVQILIDREHSGAIKQRLYAGIARELSKVGVTRDELFVALHFNGPDDWWAGSELEI